MYRTTRRQMVSTDMSPEHCEHQVKKNNCFFSSTAWIAMTSLFQKPSNETIYGARSVDARARSLFPLMSLFTLPNKPRTNSSPHSNVIFTLFMVFKWFTFYSCGPMSRWSRPNRTDRSIAIWFMAIGVMNACAPCLTCPRAPYLEWRSQYSSLFVC